MDKSPVNQVSNSTSPPATKVDTYVSNPFALIKPAWQLFKLNLGAFLVPSVLFVLALVLVGLVLVVGSVAGLKHGGNFSSPASLIALIIMILLIGLAAVVAALLFAPYPILVALASYRAEKLKIATALRQTPRYAGRFIMIGLLVAWPLLLGIVAALVTLIPLFALVGHGGSPGGAGVLLVLLPVVFIIGGIALVVITFLRSMWYSLAPYLIVEQDLPYKEAASQSKTLVKGHIVEVFAVLSLSSAVGIVPILGFFASIILSLITPVLMVIRYHQLVALQAAGGPKPKVHWANYAVIVLALISGSVGHYGPKTPPTPPATQTPVIDRPQTN